MLGRGNHIVQCNSFLTTKYTEFLQTFLPFDLIVPSQSTARIQEMHILIGHIICELIEKKLKL